MKTINEYINEDKHLSLNDKSKTYLKVNGVKLNPCKYNGEYAILIGEPIKYHEEKLIKKYVEVANSLGVNPKDSFSDFLADTFDHEPTENDFFGLIYYVQDFRYPETTWVNMDDVDFEF